MAAKRIYLNWKKDLETWRDKLRHLKWLSDYRVNIIKQHIDFKGKKVVLYFYPKDMTPGYTQESCDFRDLHKKFTKNRTVILGISKDSVESHVKFKSKYELPFALLADETTKVCKAYGVWQEKSLYGRKFMGVVRTTFVIDGKGVIQKIYDKVKVTKGPGGGLVVKGQAWVDADKANYKQYPF